MVRDKNKCKRCGKPKETGPRSELCVNCAVQKIVDTNRQIRTRRGAAYERWKAAMKKAVRKL